MQKGSMQTCKKREDIQTYGKNIHEKNMQMEMPDLKHATCLHAVLQLVVVSLCFRSGIITDLTSTDDSIFTYIRLVMNSL